MQAIQNFIERMRRERSADSNLRAFMLTVFWLTIAFVVVLLIAPRAEAMDKCFTGSWYDPDVPNTGLVIEALDSQTVAYWYTFTFFEATGQNWLVFQGADDDLTAYDVYPFGPSETRLEKVGSGELVAMDNNTILFAYDLTLNLDGLPVDGATPWCLDPRCADLLKLTRLTQPVPCP